MDKVSVSLLIITLNEERNIARCIKSALWADDIVVLDSGSTDRTVQIAQSMGARVFNEDWRGYGPQKQRAVELANYDWVLSLDADEELSPSLSREIQELFSSNKIKDFDGYTMARKTFHLGRWIMHGGWYPDFQLRLFDKKKCSWSPDILHEFVICEHSLKLKNDLHHYAFGSLFEQVRINNVYSSLGMQKLLDKNKNFSLYYLMFKPWVKFIECYFFKLGFRDGIAGFIIAVGAAYSQFLRYAKLWESKYVLAKSEAKLGFKSGVLQDKAREIQIVKSNEIPREYSTTSSSDTRKDIYAELTEEKSNKKKSNLEAKTAVY